MYFILLVSPHKSLLALGYIFLFSCQTVSQRLHLVYDGNRPYMLYVQRAWRSGFDRWMAN